VMKKKKVNNDEGENEDKSPGKIRFTKNILTKNFLHVILCKYLNF